MERYLYIGILFILVLFFLIFYFNIFLLIIILFSSLILFFYKFKKKAIIIILFLLMIYLFSLNFNQINQNYEHIAKVKSINTSSILVKENGVKYYLLGIDKNVLPGDKIRFECEYNISSNKGSFDIYWHSIGARAYGWANNVEIESYGSGIRRTLLEKLINDGSFFSQTFLALIYGIETEDNAFMLDTVTKLGVSYLFVISGFHISLLYIITEKIGMNITSNRKVINCISMMVSLFFLYFIYFPLTAIRALITIMLIRTHKFSKIDSLGICGIIFFIINPYIMMSNSMILSFTITGMIYILSNNYHTVKSSIIISVAAFYVSLPTISTWTNELNLFAPLINIILTPLISFSYIFALIIFPFHFLWIVGDIYFLIFNYILFSIKYIYLPISLSDVTMIQQYLGTLIVMVYIFILRNNKIILLNTFLLLSAILFII